MSVSSRGIWVRPVFTMSRSASSTGQSTAVCTCALVLLAEFGSVVEVETVALLVNTVPHCALCGTLKAMVTVRCWPLLSAMLLQRMFAPFCTQEGSDAVGLNVRPAGTGSLIVTPCAVAGPLFVTVTL